MLELHGKTSLYDYLHSNGNDLSNHDLAHLADWATHWKDVTPNPSWKRAYALIREGADLLLRRRAMSTVLENHIGQHAKGEEPVQVNVGDTLDAGVVVDYLPLRIQLNDFTSAFYGPHPCQECGEKTIVRRAKEDGGQAYEVPLVEGKMFFLHKCNSQVKAAGSAKTVGMCAEG